ncbi:dihydrolipoyl dehydrogenase [Algisphaera agarilytica]|uniref:Dihydrolipoyl dehydrogenase n=1 Tax=Algisphaera agarilytica TaxID=1385975 RepID=A0A7X0LL58_9BACT|nr:dihydrolipoyl dehydrogenase [Algisphaera agarilytica]MBB6429648.1 dihydrolipoamide dehydrogenase [Algisphaera agarilytica]
MANQTQFDLIVVGGGPAGYVAAIRAAQMGKSVACVERDALGGVCLNWGCIPTKALIAGAEMYSKIQHEGEDFGIKVEGLSYDWDKIIGRSRSVAGNLSNGIGFLFKKNKITHFAGHAFIPKAGMVSIYDHADVDASIDPKRPAIDQDMPAEVRFTSKPKYTLKADKILIATGASPRALPGAPFDGEKIITSKEAMNLPEKPEKLLVVGSGAIGMEFAYFYNAFGTEVTVVEMLDRVLPVEDLDVSKAAEKAFKKQGVNILTGHVTKSIETTDAGIKAVVTKVDDESKTQTIEADKVLVAIGVRGRFDGLFEDGLGIELFKGHIKTDYKAPGADYQTSVPGIYAVGDVIGPPWLAHVASEEAILCVERMYGHDAPDVDYSSIPGCTYCNPQVASIGFTEQACKEQGIEYNVGKFPFAASGKAQALGDTTGFVKLITGKEHNEILGAHMIGEGVTEMIAEMGLARRLEATAEELIATIHAHPTMSEAVHEAALGTDGRMIHF